MSEIAWGIFAATALVLLVLFPRRTVSVLGSLLGVGAIIFGAIVLWAEYLTWQREKTAKLVQAVVIKNEKTCTDPQFPHQYSLVNKSSKKVESASVTIRVRKAGFSTVIASENFMSDAILEPGYGMAYCFNFSDLNRIATAGPEPQEWSAEVASIQYAD